MTLPEINDRQVVRTEALGLAYPEQLDTLKLVRDGLNGDAYFIDTLHGPYMTAMILFRSQTQFVKLQHPKLKTKSWAHFTISRSNTLMGGTQRLEPLCRSRHPNSRT